MSVILRETDVVSYGILQDQPFLRIKAVVVM